MKIRAEAFTQYIFCGRPSLIRRSWRSSRGHTCLKPWTVSINQLKLSSQLTVKKTIEVIILWCLVSSRISRALPTWKVGAKRGNEAIACSRLQVQKAPTSLATGSKRDIVWCQTLSTKNHAPDKMLLTSYERPWNPPKPRKWAVADGLDSICSVSITS